MALIPNLSQAQIQISDLTVCESQIKTCNVSYFSFLVKTKLWICADGRNSCICPLVFIIMNTAWSAAHQTILTFYGAASQDDPSLYL